MSHSEKSRRIEDAAFWQAHLTAWKRSGQTLTAYGEAHGLARSTFGRWRQRLRGGPSQSAPKTGVVRLARVEVMAPVASGQRCRLELPNGIGIDWPTTGPGEQLASILEAARRWG